MHSLSNNSISEVIVAGHQPEFVPHLGFFNKIYQSNVFIFVDDVQYKKKSFENRNKIRSNNTAGFSFVTVPVSKKLGSSPRINQVQIANTINWDKNILDSLEHSYSQSPFYEEILGLIKPHLIKSTSLAVMNIAIIKDILSYLGIKRRIFIQSELNIKSNGTNLIIDLARFDGRNNTYLSGPFGRRYLDRAKLQKSDQKVIFTDFKEVEYKQMHKGHISGMSILDCLFNLGKNTVKNIAMFNMTNWD